MIVESQNSSERSTAGSLRVLTYNTYYFPRIEAMRDLIRRADADVICLQEVLVTDSERTPANQAQWLAEELGYYLAINSNWRRYQGTGGNALLLRTPPIETDVLVDSEGYRFAITAIHEVAGQQFAIVAGHFLWLPRPLPIGFVASIFRRTSQIRQAVNWAKVTGLPALIAGDFNMLPWSPEYWSIAPRLTDCSRAVAVNHRNTRPTWGFAAQLDYVFVSNHFEVLACQTVDFSASDHRPVIADIAMRADRQNYGASSSSLAAS